MCFDLRVLIAEAVVRRSLEQMLPVRLLSLIKTSGKIDDYHLGKYFIAMIVTSEEKMRAQIGVIYI
jgi:hypothetical protein